MQLVDHQHIIRIILNKADQVDKATLRRVRNVPIAEPKWGFVNLVKRSMLMLTVR